jgi:hypothetical protein
VGLTELAAGRASERHPRRQAAVVRGDDRRQRRALLRVQRRLRAGALPLPLSAGEGPAPPLYDQFRAGVAADPTGYKTLVRVLGNPDMPRFEKQWQAWVLALEAD